MRWAVSRCVRPDHPAFAGHFPDDPIVPAVVILNEVLDALRDRMPGVALRSVPVAKFVNPLRPDVTFQIALDAVGGQIQFECRAGELLIAQGRLDVETAP